MRISDWSSDVCSSDLPPKKHWVDAGRAGQLIRRDNAGGRAGTDRHGGAIHRSNGMAERASAPLAHPIACRFFCEGSIVIFGLFKIPPPRDHRIARPSVPPLVSAAPGGGAWRFAQTGRDTVAPPSTIAHSDCVLL